MKWTLCEALLPRRDKPSLFLRGRSIWPVSILFLVMIPPGVALCQSPKARQDPIPASIRTAYNDRRLADAEALLKTAIHDAEVLSPVEPRIDALLGLLANVEGWLNHPQEALEAAQRMLAYDEKALGSQSPIIIEDLGTVAAYYEMTGDHNAAEKAYEQSLAMARDVSIERVRESLLPLCLYRLAHFYMEKHRAADAKALLNEAVGICETREKLGDSMCSQARAELAELYHQEGNFKGAEDVASSGVASTIDGNSDWSFQVNSLDTLAHQYEEEGGYELAEATYRQAVAVIEKAPKVEDKSSAEAGQMVRIGQLFEKEGRFDEAEEIYKKSLSVAESAVTTEHPYKALSLDFYLQPLVGLYRQEKRLSEIETILRQALELKERSLGSDSPRLGGTPIELAMVCAEEGKYADAEQLFQRAIQMNEKVYGPDSTQLPALLYEYADLLQRANQPEKAEAVVKRAAALREKLQQKRPATTGQNSKN